MQSAPAKSPGGSHNGDEATMKQVWTAVAAAVFAVGAQAADPIKIGVAGPFTGGSSSMGVSMRDGVRLAVDEINAAGGVIGRKIELIERDDEAKNERGVQIAQELINKEKVVATVGFINTGVALASQRFYQEAKIPVMNNVATGSIITHQFDKEPENYIFRNAVLDYAAGKPAQLMAANLELLREAYPPQAFTALMNLLSTHDQPRALHHFGEDSDLALAKRRLRLAVFFQMTYPGSPTIYYGDEVGQGGGDDPFNRAPYPWADEGGQPDEALLADFKRLTQLRHELPVLRHGTLSAPLHADQHVVVLARQDGKTWAITATNNSTAARTVSVVVPFDAARLRDALGGEG
eukprot:gene44304-54175_t